jgi:ferredoxin
LAHRASPPAYESLTHRLNRFPQGAPPSDLLLRILRILFSEGEAELVSRLPIKPFTARRAAALWQLDEPSARRILEGLAGRALLVDIAEGEEIHYVLPPPMAGFFEFSLMRVREDIDQKLLSELFYQYLNVEEEFVRELFASGETQLGRAFVNESALARSEDRLPDQRMHVLDYERASEVVRSANAMGVSDCYCRVKMHHVGRACEAPLDICMTFNTSAESLIRHGHARRVDVAEGLDLLQRAHDEGLVQFGENVRERVNFICNCCGCCCEAMIAARRFAVMHPIHTTNFLPAGDDACTGCGKCVTACPVEAMLLTSANDPHQPGRKLARLDEERCLGCGVCVRACPVDVLTLVPRPQRVITPLNSAHRVVLMAIERGKLQDLIFDNRLLLSHRALAALLGAILRLPPVKRLMATDQVRSRYLEALAKRYA